MKKILVVFLLALLAGPNRAQCWRSVSQGEFNAIGIQADGSLWAWGYNTTGTYTTNTLPTQVGTDTTWRVASAGFGYALAVKADGSLWAWGRNDYGQLGDGTFTDNYTPHQVGSNWRFVDAGMYYAIGIKNDSTLWSWGNNDYGQAGTNNPNPSALHQQVGDAGLRWLAADANVMHSLGVLSDGRLCAWGNNSSGQLGDSTIYDSYEPVRVGSANNWKAVAAGNLHSMALKSDGTVWTWGDNGSGQLGDSSVSYSRVIPTQMGTAANWKNISTGTFHSMGLRADGTLWTWGWNEWGQVGNGSSNLWWKTPVQIGASDWASIAGGVASCWAKKTNGSAWAWGYNAYGVLGDGTTTDRRSPVVLNCLYTGIHSQEAIANPLMVFPNPAKEFLYFQRENNQPIDQLLITNLLGQTLLEKKEADPGQVSIKDLPPGVYYLKVLSGHSSSATKFIKD